MPDWAVDIPAPSCLQLCSSHPPSCWSLAWRSLPPAFSWHLERSGHGSYGTHFHFLESLDVAGMLCWLPCFDLGHGGGVGRATARQRLCWQRALWCSAVVTMLRKCLSPCAVSERRVQDSIPPIEPIGPFTTLYVCGLPPLETVRCRQSAYS